MKPGIGGIATRAKRAIGCALPFLFAFLPLLLLVDNSRWFDCCTPVVRSSAYIPLAEIRTEQRDFLLKQYDTAVHEIHTRIEHEHLLFGLKFTLMGAALGLVFHDLLRNRGRPHDTDSKPPGPEHGGAAVPPNDLDRVLRSPTAAVLCWAAVGISAVVDARLLYNTEIIRHLGSWVMSFESQLLPAGAVGWETYFAQGSMWTSPFSPYVHFDRQLLTWLLYLVVFYSFVVRARNGVMAGSLDAAPVSIPVLEIARVAMPVCFSLFTIVGITHYMQAPVPCLRAHVLFGALSVFFAWLWLFRASRRAQPANRQESQTGSP